MDFEFKRASTHNINIRHTANGGCIIKVGCCEAAFTTPDEMLETLADYYKDPDRMEKEYNKKVGPPMETSDPIGHSLGEAPNRVTSAGSSLRDHQVEDSMDRIDDGQNCEESGPDRRR